MTNFDIIIWTCDSNILGSMLFLTRINKYASPGYGYRVGTWGTKHQHQYVAVFMCAFSSYHFSHKPKYEAKKVSGRLCSYRWIYCNTFKPRLLKFQCHWVLQSVLMGLIFIKHHELGVCYCYHVSHLVLFDVAKCLNGSKNLAGLGVLEVMKAIKLILMHFKWPRTMLWQLF